MTDRQDTASLFKARTLIDSYLKGDISLDERVERKLFQYTKSISKLREAHSTLEELEPLVQEYDSYNPVMYVTDTGNIGITLFVESMDQVTEILRRFGQAGFRQTREKTESHPVLMYYLSKDVTLDFFFRGSKCQWVPTGEKIEVDKFELKCD